MNEEEIRIRYLTVIAHHGKCWEADISCTNECPLQSDCQCAIAIRRIFATKDLEFRIEALYQEAVKRYVELYDKADIVEVLI